MVYFNVDVHVCQWEMVHVSRIFQVVNFHWWRAMWCSEGMLLNDLGLPDVETKDHHLVCFSELVDHPWSYASESAKTQ